MTKMFNGISCLSFLTEEGTEVIRSEGSYHWCWGYVDGYYLRSRDSSVVSRLLLDVEMYDPRG